MSQAETPENGLPEGNPRSIEARVERMKHSITEMEAEEKAMIHAMRHEGARHEHRQQVYSIGNNIKNIFTTSFVLFYAALLLLEGHWGIKTVLIATIFGCVGFYMLAQFEEERHLRYLKQFDTEQHAVRHRIAQLKQEIHNIEREEKRRKEEERRAQREAAQKAQEEAQRALEEAAAKEKAAAAHARALAHKRIG